MLGLQASRVHALQLPALSGKREGESAVGVTATFVQSHKTPSVKPEEMSTPVPIDDQVGIGGFAIRVLFDTGAAGTYIGSIAAQIATACGISVSPILGRNVRMVNGSMSTITGRAELPFDVAGIRKYITVLITPDLGNSCYLGADFIRQFNAQLNPREDKLTIEGSNEEISLEVDSAESFEKYALAAIGIADMGDAERQILEAVLLEVLPEETGPLGCTNLVEFDLEVTTTRPIKQKYYSVSKKIEEEMHAPVKKMLVEGIIEPAKSGWSSPVVMVRKANGKYRFCIDYRKLNAVSKKNAYPLPRMETILRKLQNARYISTIDLSSAYYQIPVKEEAPPLTAFAVPGLGLFQ